MRELVQQAPLKISRSDARRNRARIFSAAKECFANGNASTGMEDIARRAGVGVGSLYRAFGNRAGLAEAVFRDMLDELAAAASDLSADTEPWGALRTWINAYIEKLLSKRAIMKELQPLFDHDPDLADNSHRLAADALGVVLSRAQAAGLVRADLQAPDLLQLVIGIVGSGSSDRRRIDTMLDVILSGIRIRQA